MDLGRTEKGFPTAQLFLLGLCRIAEPVALTSPLPYAYDLMEHLLGNNTNNAAFYAGLFVAAFSLTETLTGFWWGALSDRIGRKPVLILGCAGTIASLCLLGFAMNIWMAILGRALGGALNGNVGVVQTMVGEMVTRPEHEARAYAVIPFFFSVGCTIGPALGGILAQQTLGGTAIFEQFPYLLPNIACAGMVLVTMVLAYLALDETHPELRKKALGELGPSQQPDHGENAPLLQPAASSTSGPAHTDSLWDLNTNVKMLIAAVCLLSAHTVTYIQLLPIFLRSPRDDSVPPYYIGGIGGLDMSLSEVGLVMGVNGIIGLGIQLIFPVFTDWFGLKTTLLMMTSLHPIAYFCLPYLPFLPASTWRVGLWTWLVARNILSTFTYPALLILIKRWTPNTLILGRVNGLVASAGAACRTVSPAAAGLLQSIGENHHLSALAWWGSGVFALIAAIQSWFIRFDGAPN
ncbi:MFS general substrate transporter [Aspergillus sclerotioniger CBS 115572]|uniref:MFS general substrate transporter n=1 Tax=Aspergillus sclerotioniger CBS 115572 TaxID=1450535 RepID=A0A317V4L4_9EURO|nr:MFS general substrate transporter [Aspergillus sclerotioniger CBS 115572]PWY68018.1 MFS general substrate transporter [Aspergillus sclerotioniger CBS 115572]